MRRRARPAPMSPLSSAVALAVPGVLVLLLSGCAGVGNYLDSTVNPFGNPNSPKGDTINMQRARGNDVAVQPILPQPGDVWPGKLRPVPTLGEIQSHMNVPLGQEYNDQYGNGAGGAKASNTYTLPPGAAAQGMRTNPHTREGGSFSPGSAQSPLPGTTAPATPRAMQPPTATGTKGFTIGQTLVGPSGPVGVVNGKSNGRYQTVSPIAGQGGGILISNGNGTATLIQPNGQVVTVTGR